MVGKKGRGREDEEREGNGRKNEDEEGRETGRDREENRKGKWKNEVLHFAIFSVESSLPISSLPFFALFSPGGAQGERNHLTSS